ncbi:MAG: ferredoxin--NADP(+) reductase [Planctomycetota bacterium]|nr:MAG: ferredoxin--NADP(+) reductase [Planctomycetota bacterium]
MSKPLTLSDKILKRMRPARLVRKDPVGGQAGLALLRYEPLDGQPVFPDGRFKAGQYCYLAVQVEGRWLNRLYSIASAPCQRHHLELYIVLVENGAVTPTLFAQPIGAEVLYMGPAGKFTLEKTERPDLCLIATGTGLAPYVSMLRQLRHELRAGGGASRPRRITLFEGVRYARDLGYHSLLREMEQEGELDLVYIPTVSRPERDEGFNASLGRGRVNHLVRAVLGDEAIEARVPPALPYGLDAETLRARLHPETTAVYLCGNPGMIAELQQFLGARGYDQILTEDYW